MAAPLVTISAAFGTGGSRVAPAVADPRHPDHPHLVLDTTAVGLEAAVDVIVMAARARTPAPAASA